MESNGGPHGDHRVSVQMRFTRGVRNGGVAWLYRDERGVECVKVNPNITIAQLRHQFGPPETPDAEVGIHSEAQAAEWFRTRPALRVLQIFSERVPCPMMCAPMLRRYFPGVPWYYYYDRRSWFDGSRGRPRRPP
jgi:hypothetical protein